jgi:hypothetical protein
MEAGAVIKDKDYRKLLHEVIPNCTFHYGYDMSMYGALDIVLQGSRDVVQIRDGRYMLVSGQSGAYLLGRGFMWIDMQDGIAIGGFYFHPTNGEPTPTVNLFSEQVKEAALEMNQLPPAFAADLRAWSEDKRLPDITTRYFITGSKKKIVLQHDEDYCAPMEGFPPYEDSCQQMNADAADVDVEAAYYVDATGHATNATAQRAYGADYGVFIAARNAACLGAADPLACHILRTREHTRLIVHRNPVPVVHPR